jgi:hypothetical protein
MNSNVTLFDAIVRDVATVGRLRHEGPLLANAARNSALASKTLSDLPPLPDSKLRSAVVVSAGPSIRSTNAIERLAASDYAGTVICVDGSLLACLDEGLMPDYVVTLDPHPTRVVRWFGDPNFEEHTRSDDYFQRQDLDVTLRRESLRSNAKDIELVDRCAPQLKLLICSSVAATVADRATEAGFDMYWWNPLVDDPSAPDSLTRKIHRALEAPCLNTGGTVGTAAWVVAEWLGIPTIAVHGMDFGYPESTPITQTQTYYELLVHLGSPDAIAQCFPKFVFPLTGESFYTDPTYDWYRRNFLELAKLSRSKTINCTEGGTLIDSAIECQRFADFLAGH